MHVSRPKKVRADWRHLLNRVKELNKDLPLTQALELAGVHIESYRRYQDMESQPVFKPRSAKTTIWASTRLERGRSWGKR